jgi:biotin carboxyl carrier protein
MDFHVHVGPHRYRVREAGETEGPSASGSGSPGGEASSPEAASLPDPGGRLLGVRETPVVPPDSGPSGGPSPEPVQVALGSETGNPVRGVRVGRRSLALLPRRMEGGRWILEVDGHRYEAQVNDRGQEAVRQLRKATGAGAGLAPLRAPMPGLVVRVEVAVGEVVEAGDGVIIVEAMKMENELKAPARARVTGLPVEAGTAVEKNTVLVEFGPVEEEG